MAGFLDEFVKLTVNETIGTDYPHIRHPALCQAKVMEGTVKDGASYVTLPHPSRSLPSPLPGTGDGRDREGWGIVCDAAVAEGKRGDG